MSSPKMTTMFGLFTCALVTIGKQPKKNALTEANIAKRIRFRCPIGFTKTRIQEFGMENWRRSKLNPTNNCKI